ncbi:MAG: 50S ribosomal protein L6 [Candidatus Micrarchaeota archaeon]
MEKLQIPSGITVEVKKNNLAVSGKGKTFEIPFDNRITGIKVEASEIVFNFVDKENKNKRACTSSIVAHVKNAFIGIETGFSKKLQVVYSHFPVSIEIKGCQGVIKNFLGEKLPRVAEIIGDTKVDVKGQDIVVSGSSKYAVGQTANNFIIATRIKGKDRRVFQDGIYPVI